MFVYAEKELCPHCLENLETYMEVVEQLKNKYLDTKFFYFDAQLNEVENWNFENLPDLLYLDSEQNLRNYSGIMSQETITSFIEK